MEQLGPILERIGADVWWVVGGIVLLAVLLLFAASASVLRRLTRLRRQRRRLHQMSIMLEALGERAAALQRRAHDAVAGSGRPQVGTGRREGR